MKKKLLFSLATLLILTSKSQVVFCPPHAVWTNVFTRSWPGQTLEYENVVYTGKQILGLDTVKVLWHKRFFIEVNEGYTGPTYIKQKGDTIFMQNVRTNNSWQILCNFAALPGNSWKNNLYIGNTTNSITVLYTTTVISTQTVNVNGFNLKQLTVIQDNNMGSPNHITYTITERLGSNMFLFTFGGMAHSDGDYFIENLCYSDSTFGTLQHGAHTCDYLNTLGLDKISDNFSALNIYPNPANDLVTIKMDAPANKKFTLKINDVTGRQIDILELEPGIDFRLRISGYEPGIYHANTIYEGKSVETKKLIVIR